VGAVTGAFQSIVAPTFSGLTIDLLQNAGALQLTVVGASLPGDFNHDNIVDAADYVFWRKTDGTSAGYNAWRAHFGEMRGSGSGASANAAIPEPATLVLLLFAAACWCLRRGRTA
jgi:hypothetical protein